MLAPQTRWLVPALLVLTACSPQATATDRPGSEPTSPAPTATIAATPTLAAMIGRPQIANRPAGQVVITGIVTNRADAPVQDLRLTVHARAADGALLGTGLVEPLLPWLPPGGESPYQLTFTADQPAAQADAELASYHWSDRESAPVQVEIESVTSTVDGGSRVLGWLQPPRTSGANLDGFVFASFDGGALTGISDQLTTLRWLPARTAAPFEAIFAGAVEPLSLTPYLVARAIEGPTDDQLQVELDPGLQLDPQGNPFITGSIHNTGATAMQAEIVLSVSRDGRLLRVLPIGPELPIEPSERRPFGLRTLDLPPSLDPQAVQLQAYIGGSNSNPRQTVQLNTTITSFEQIGGSLFLRGQVENGSGGAVRTPTLLAAVRSTDGQLWSAASQTVANQLADGANAAFVIDLPLPDGADVRTAEFDIRALAVQPESAP